MDWNKATGLEIAARFEKVSKMLNPDTMQVIGLSNDGKTFVESDASDAAQTLIKLKQEGYCVPQYAIDALLES